MAEGVASTELAKSDNTFYGLMRRLLRSKAAIFGLVIIGLMFICALFAPLIATHDYAKQDLPSMLQPPSNAHLFGTDEFGRDIFSRVIYGSRVSIKVGFLAVGISLLTGLFFGSIAGYYGRLLDSVICALIDIALAFPMTLLAIAIIAVLGPGLFNVCLAIALSSWGSFARIARGQFLSLKNQEFVEAARILGYSDARIIFRHILPNSLAPLVVLTTLEVPKAIIVEATLSFLGLGIQPPLPSWGSIMSSGRSFLFHAPWITIFPGVMIILIVMGFNLLGDALRDSLDPRLRD
ncbi:ABC transporter permease [Acetomicrobium sp.]|jgi:peptide/nickel transport system permease protein|uniref:ABC transporter permease n=1 Tax=Acetomicrobium sp. TaxID=1872099 RepID=UPI0016ADBE17|nr:ABC transporter permease [Acetomicrobium sp.]NLI43692.1 ABC transporter permease [Synergistaceae bacterium]